MATGIDLEFGDGTYSFALKLPGIKAIQEASGIGIGGLRARLTKGAYLGDAGLVGESAEAEYRVEDVVEVIRQGLIGGGLTPVAATRLIDTYVMEQPLRDAWMIATAVVMACIDGYEPPVLKKKEASESEADVMTDGLTTPTP